MSLLVLSGLTCVFYTFILLTGGALAPGFRFSAFTIIFLLGGSIFASTIFNDFGQKKKAINALTLPASHFEKFLMGWVYSYLVFSVVFGGCFWLIDYSFVKFAPARTQSPNLFEVIPQNGLLVTLMVFSLLHGCALLGSAYFKHLHFVKTALVFFGTIILLTLFHQSLLNALFPDVEVMFGPPILARGINLDAGSMQIQHVQLEKAELHLYTGVFIISFTLVMWAASYFQIKEKQI